MNYIQGNLQKADFSAELFQARKEVSWYIQVLKGKTSNQEYTTWQLSFLSKYQLSFMIEGMMKSFPDNQKLKEFITT